MLVLTSLFTLLNLLPSAFAEDSLHPIYLPDPQIPITNTPSKSHEFKLTYIFHHGGHKYPNLHRRLNVTNPESITILDPNGIKITTPQTLRAKSETLRIERLKDRSQEHIDYLLDTGRTRGEPVSLDPNAWTLDDVSGPNITDKETVLSMARISANAYVGDRSKPGWFDVGHGFNYTDDFGWENDGLRGHIFADETNQTIIVGIKGTSPAVFDGEGTTTNDKINDNLFFSCCCGEGGKYGWLQVCDCQMSTFTCNATCVVESLRSKNRYYYAAQEIYRNVSEIYPNADIWLAGHSLGGSVASLVALTYGIPVVTFEAPGEAMPAKRLGLPTPPGYHLGSHQQRLGTGGFHFGHTADPIYMGTCNTYSSVCTIAGYAMQSVCHSGSTCTYDTVKDLGWRVGAGTHKIISVIHDVIEKYDEPAVCSPMTDCTDCFEWDFVNSNHSDIKTSKTTKTTTKTTRTSTCETPGWFGCLDETSATTTTETTTSTTTCKTPGWFGCDDGTITTTQSTTASSSSIFSLTSISSLSSKTSLSPSKSSSIPKPTTSKEPEEHCVRRNWIGWCKEWKPVLVPNKLDL